MNTRCRYISIFIFILFFISSVTPLLAANFTSYEVVDEDTSTGNTGGGGGGGGGGGSSSSKTKKLQISCIPEDTTIGIGSTINLNTTVTNASSTYTIVWKGSMTKFADFDKTKEDQTLTFLKTGTYSLRVEIKDKTGKKAKATCKSVKVASKYGSVTTATANTSTNTSIANTSNTSPITVSTPTYNFPPGLRLGQESEYVKILQKYFNSNGIIVNTKPGLPGSVGNESTYFGNLTTDALTKFQQAKKLTVNGLFTEEVRVIINASK